MFLKARIRLTAWYLLILMAVSISFSVIIYNAATFELSRFAQMQKQRFERRMMLSEMLDTELLNEAKKRIILNLGILNVAILGIASVLGYYLSGKTLEPIQEMVDSQYRFVSDASHELKTPITAMKTTLEVALRDKKLGIIEAKNTLVTSLEEVDRLQKLAEGLLELSRDQLINPEEFDAYSILNNAKKAIEPLAALRKIKILLGKNPKIKVFCNPQSIERVILSILDNAVKYSKVGAKVEMNIKSENKRTIFVIKDYGRGIDDADLKHIFDRFYRADKSRHTQGYGLGLSIAQKIVIANKGQIVVKSIKNVGTKVSISLPSVG